MGNICGVGGDRPEAEGAPTIAASPRNASEEGWQSNARLFFSACEAGKGWDVCSQWVAGESAKFSAQVTGSLPGPKLTEVATVKGYTEWMAGVVKGLGEKATVHIKGVTFDNKRKVAVFCAVFGGFSDYAYAFNFDRSDKIAGMTKIWNDEWAGHHMAQIGQRIDEQPMVICRVKPNDVLGLAQGFFDACEAGEGWGACAQYVAADAKFSAQVTDSLPGPKLTEVKTVQEYTEFMVGIVQAFGPKATVDIKGAAFDAEHNVAVFYAQFAGFSDYVYSLEYDEGGKIRAMTKILHDGWAAAAVAAAEA